MSKSLGNYVGIAERPEDIFGKLMSLSDDLMWRYYELLTRIPETEIAALRAGHPMEAKKRLSFALTALYHGDDAARRAQAHFERVIQQRQEPEVLAETTVGSPRDEAFEGKVLAPGSSRYLWSVMKEVGLVLSTSEARRLIEQGAVAVDRIRVTAVDHVLPPGDHTVQVGKRRFIRVVLEGPCPDRT
jgi:tyrosyl-tRNA synthetase